MISQKVMSLHLATQRSGVCVCVAFFSSYTDMGVCTRLDAAKMSWLVRRT